MSVSADNATRSTVLNLPNQLTALRFVLAVIMFVGMAYEYYGFSTVLFVLAISTDWLDGYLARKYDLVTTLGRILDPFVDKIVICGSFVFLLGASHPDIDRWLRAWMVVVVIGRELLVTALRSFLEQQGADFSATMSGKLKMVLQSAAAGLGIFYLSYQDGSPPDWLGQVVPAAIWSAVAITVYSGAVYVQRAVQLLRG